MEVSEEHWDFFVCFMHPYGPSKLSHWPNIEDTYLIPEIYVLIVRTPLRASSQRTYRISIVPTMVNGANGPLFTNTDHLGCPYFLFNIFYRSNFFTYSS